MSGTSLDGVDAVLVDFAGGHTQVLGHCSAVLAPELKAEFLALNAQTNSELHRAALAANALARLYAHQVTQLLACTDTAASSIKAIGAHGQTVRHRPGEFDGVGYTLQLNQPALLAELCGIDVVADFRSRDVAAGGQGAPLVPPFHQQVFSQAGKSVAVLNIGGIANVTLLPADTEQPLTGFDCGPGNALMDSWCLAHTGRPFDDAGRWAAAGTVHQALLAAMLAETFFSRLPPKSTGRDLFNTPWLEGYLSGFVGITAQDVQATLAELTALSCAREIVKALPDCTQLVVCGGGALNTHLMERLQAALPQTRVASSTERGLPPLQVEATAFAWLARQTLLRQTGSVKSVTGAKGARILGAIYPA